MEKLKRKINKPEFYLLIGWSILCFNMNYSNYKIEKQDNKKIVIETTMDNTLRFEDIPNIPISEFNKEFEKSFEPILQNGYRYYLENKDKFENPYEAGVYYARYKTDFDLYLFIDEITSELLFRSDNIGNLNNIYFNNGKKVAIEKNKETTDYLKNEQEKTIEKNIKTSVFNKKGCNELNITANFDFCDGSNKQQYGFNRAGIEYGDSFKLKVDSNFEYSLKNYYYNRLKEYFYSNYKESYIKKHNKIMVDSFTHGYIDKLNKELILKNKEQKNDEN